MTQIPFVKLSRNLFQALPSMKSSLDEFYTQRLGMTRTDCNHNDSSLYNFSSKTLNCASQQFIYSSSFDGREPDTEETTRRSNPAYWKIGLTVPDVNKFRSKLTTKYDITVSNPRQIEDIGYLCHLKDPMGNGLEILQHTMELGNNTDINTSTSKYSKNINSSSLNLNPICIGQITLRIGKDKESVLFYQNILGMQLLSVQKCDKYNFLLYFFGYDGINTNNNSGARDYNYFESVVESREWLWQQPYTTLELVYNYDKNEYILPKENQVGWQGIVIESEWNINQTKEYLQSKCYQYGIEFQCQQLDSDDQIVRCIQDANGKQSNKSILKIKDPSGNPIFVHCKV